MKNIFLFLLLFYFYNFSSGQPHIGDKKLYYGVTNYPETFPGNGDQIHKLIIAKEIQCLTNINE